MDTLLLIFASMAVFGLGVTLVDMFGLLGDDSNDSDGSDVLDSDSDSFDGDSLDVDSSDSESPMETDELLDGSSRHQSSSVLASDEKMPANRSFFRFVSRSLSLLRNLVYFCLGAGPTGVFGILTGYGLLEVLAWSGGAGAGILLAARFIRSLARRDLDSTISINEYLFDEAVITVPVLPGQIGKGTVRRYEREVELYMRSRDSGETLRRGDHARIIEILDEICTVEKLPVQ
ncbi:hypothetical protein [Spirochaeta dissipatitropha]